MFENYLNFRGYFLNKVLQIYFIFLYLFNIKYSFYLKTLNISILQFFRLAIF